MALVPNCVVCLQPYDDFRHVPRVLACGHSFCELCLMQLQSAWRPSATNDSDPPGAGAVIRCPECSRRTRLPVGGQQSLPKNVELLRLLPSLLKESESTEEGERDSTEGERDTGKKSEDDKEFEGNSTNRLSARRRLVEDGVRSRMSGNRRLNVKERFDSNCSPESVAGSVGSWLVPRDLYAGNFKADARTWILPEKAIKLREDSSRFRPANNPERELLCGEIIVEHDRLSSSIPVTLLQLQVCRPKEDTLTYEQSVLKVWEALDYEVKSELLMLFRISLVCRRLCSVLGLWMDTRSKLFLVGQSSPHEIVPAWEIILKSYQIEELPDGEPEDANDKRESNEGSTVQDDVSLPTGEAKRMELPAKSVSSATTAQILNRVGLGLCEALWEAHSQGLIFGLVSPNCLVLDRFSCLIIDVNAVLNERFSLHDALSRLHDMKLKLEGLSSFEVHECLDLHSSRNCWQYMSPEALSLLINNLAEGGDSNATAGSPSRASERVQGRLTCKSDVWSLGCLLLELLSGQTPYDGLTLEDVVRKVLVERGKPGDVLKLDNSLENGAHCDECKDSERRSDSKGFQVLLLKCFEHDPDQRPELDTLWLKLLELGSSDGFSMKSATEHLHRQLASNPEQMYWILCLPGFVRDGYLDSWDARKANVQESQRRWELSRLDNGAEGGRELQLCGLELKGSLDGHRGYITALVVCGDHLLSASFDRTIRIWSLEDNQVQRCLEGHLHVITALAVDHKTLRCFSGDNGGNICAWRLAEDKSEGPFATWEDHNDWRYTGVTSLAVSADGILYSGSGDKTIKAWSLQDFSRLGTMEGHKALVSALLVDGELLYSGSWDGTIHVWWRNDHSRVAVLGGGAPAVPTLGGVRTLCMSDSFLYAGRDSGAIQVWRDEECLTTVQAHDMIVSTLYVEGDFLYTGSWDQHIKAWKVDEFVSNPSPTLVKNCDSALSSIVSDGDRLYAGLADSVIKVYSLLGDTWASLVEMLNP